MLEDVDACAADLPPVQGQAVTDTGLSLARLTARTCRWPLWPDHMRPTPEAARYCGADIAEGSVYCSCHAAQGQQPRTAPLSRAVLKVAHAGTAPARRAKEDISWPEDDGEAEMPRVRAPSPPLPVAPRPTPQAVEHPSVFLARYREVAERLKSGWHRPRALVQPALVAPPMLPPSIETVEIEPVIAPPKPATQRALAGSGKWARRASKMGERAAQNHTPAQPEYRRSVAAEVGARHAEHTSAVLPALAMPDGTLDLPAPPKVIRVGAIVDLVCARYGIARVDLISPRRHKVMVEARHVVMWLASTYTSQSFPAIGRVLGGRDHTTVMYGVYKIDAQRTVDVRLAANLAALATDLMAQP